MLRKETLEKIKIGSNFGRLTVVSEPWLVKENGKYRWLVKVHCSCEGQNSSKEILINHLTAKRPTSSCGCLATDLHIEQTGVKIGDIFGHWTVIGEPFIERLESYACKKVAVQCSCMGSESQKIVGVNNLKRGKTQSCGCLKHKHLQSRVRRRTHGLSKHPLFSKWQGMIQRCTNPKDPSYHHYGERGIGVSQIWLDSFESFYHWSMANGWHPKATLDRIDNNLSYSDSNCRWVDWFTQANNKRNNVYYTKFGSALTLSQICRDPKINIHKLSEKVLRGRIKSHWTIADAIDTPHSTSKLPTAFGKTQSWYDWQRDAERNKFKISAEILRCRVVKSGWTLEQALATPMKQAKTIQGFDQAKTIKEWVEDASHNTLGIDAGTLSARIKRGWSLEKALATPNKSTARQIKRNTQGQ